MVYLVCGVTHASCGDASWVHPMNFSGINSFFMHILILSLWGMNRWLINSFHSTNQIQKVRSQNIIPQTKHTISVAASDPTVRSRQRQRKGAGWVVRAVNERRPEWEAARRGRMSRKKTWSLRWEMRAIAWLRSTVKKLSVLDPKYLGVD